MNKIFAIGDIHGCFNQLQRLIKYLAIDQQYDTLVIIGIDTGAVCGGRLTCVELPKVIIHQV